MSFLKQWRFWLSLLLLGFCFYFIQPNFNSNNTDSKLNFGLDIQGGYSYLLELNENEFKQNLLVKTIQALESSYDIQSEISNDQIFISSDQNTDVLNNLTIQSLGFEIIDRNNDGILLGLLEQNFNQSLSEMTLNAVEIVRSRVDFLGNKELSLQKVGLNKILLEIPGNLDTNVKDVISKTAKLTFHLEKNSLVNSKVFFNEETGEEIRVQDIPNLTGDYIQDASLQYNQNEPVVSFSFNKEGSDLFAKMTSENVGSRFAIVLDGALITAPVIREMIPGGSGQISGNFTNESANNLAIILKSGSLPTEIKIIQEKQVGPTLGREGVKKGVYASLIALIAITIFMIAYYKVSGLFTAITIISCLGMLFALMSLLNTTLTLPGVIGIVLTIGMCVDANVLVFERIRENYKNSIENPKNDGFGSAYVTILDSNLTTLFAAIFLFAFGFGPIRGFSISLIIGIISSLIVTFIVLKFFIDITSGKYLGLNK
ncbi:protein translocase subunit SecD [Alphaproteobacteria bacterium]|nr:protein translocase subunit SecD [Alphaproteobacteria bacterium]